MKPEARAGIRGTRVLVPESMIKFSIPGLGEYRLEHLVMDVNGTLAVDGQLIEGVAVKIASLRQQLIIHLLTADTHGKQALIDQQLGLTALRIKSGGEARQKAEYVRRLGSETVAAIGQGANDVEMLAAAQLGICVMSPEGVATGALLASDLVAPTILAALELFETPARIVATMRR
jgi:P-type E1-E2 ATPase